MDLILDTTILIDAERRKLDLDDLVGDQDSVSIAAITLAELLHGVELGEGRQRERRQAFAEAIASHVPVVTYDRRVAATHAMLLAHVQRAGRPRGAHDLIIAATAATHKLTLVTADTDGFVDLPGVSLRSMP